MSVALRLIAVISLIVFSGCKEKAPVGPIADFEGVKVGVHLSKLVDALPAEHETFLYADRVLVGKLVDYIPDEKRLVKDLFQSLYDIEIYYDLNTLMVFEALFTMPRRFFEADCRIYGKALVD